MGPGKNEGRYIDEKFLIQGSFLHFFQGVSWTGRSAGRFKICSHIELVKYSKGNYTFIVNNNGDDSPIDGVLYIRDNLGD